MYKVFNAKSIFVHIKWPPAISRTVCLFKCNILKRNGHIETLVMAVNRSAFPLYGLQLFNYTYIFSVCFSSTVIKDKITLK